MKARIERERIPAGEDPQFHLKLGRGSLSDVEWTAQLLQLRHGVRATVAPSTRSTGCVAPGLLDPADAAVLAERLPVLRAHPQPALPRAGPPGRLAAPGAERADLAGPLARHDAGRAARAVPAGHPTRPTAMERLFYGGCVEPARSTAGP